MNGGNLWPGGREQIGWLCLPLPLAFSNPKGKKTEKGKRILRAFSFKQREGTTKTMVPPAGWEEVSFHVCACVCVRARVLV